MGALALPTAGTIYLDTDAIIYSVEKIAPYWPLLQTLWLSAQTGAVVVISSELALLETLVKPPQTGNLLLEKTYRALLIDARETRLVPVDRSVLEQAARLRAITAIKTPDAIHAATALRESCGLFISNDPVYRRVSGLPIAIL